MKEACDIFAVPTTSTTMQIALGDALAIALIERRSFTASDFHIFHPSGKLGSELCHISDIMHKGDELPFVTVDTPMTQVLIEMSRKNLGCVGIIDTDGTLIGIITDDDLRHHIEPELLKRHAGDLMHSKPKTIIPTTLVSETLRFFNEKNITSLFVVENDKPIGLVHIHDFLRKGIAI
jgi:arabinose-5-phosphate isomerase